MADFSSLNGYNVKDSYARNIVKNLPELESRVNNLSRTNGGTTGDAELVDARVDANGNVFSNVGNNIRSGQRNTNDLLNTFTVPVFEKVEKSMNTGWYDADGYFNENDGYRCFIIDVKPGEVYYLHSRFGYSCYGAICLDANNNVLSRHLYSPDTVTISQFEVPIVIPEGGAKLEVNGQPKLDNNMYYNYYLPYLVKVVGYELGTNGLGEYFGNIANTISNDSCTFGTAGTLSYAMIMEDGRVNSNGVGEKYTLLTAEVKPGETYRINAHAHYQKYTWVLHNTVNYPVMFGPQSGNPTDTYVTDEIITIPVGAKYLHVGGINGDAKIEKLVSRIPEDIPKSWSHLRWTCVGDSLTELNDRTNKHYFDYVQDKTGIYVINMGVSGTGYKRNEENNTAFYQRITNVPLNTDVVTIFGSGNDGGAGELGTPTDTGTDTICGCINTTLDNLYTILPTVQVGIVSPTPWGGQTPDNPDCFMYKYSEALKTICYNRGIPFLDLFRLSGFRTMKDGAVNTETHNLLFSKDPEGNCTHPNELGHKIISSHFYKFLTGLIGTY